MHRLPKVGSSFYALLLCGRAPPQHYILNNQETDRSGGNMLADETTIMELYAPPFASVADKVAGYMCSYNRLDSQIGLTVCDRLRVNSSPPPLLLVPHGRAGILSTLSHSPTPAVSPHCNRLRPVAAGSTGCMPVRTPTR